MKTSEKIENKINEVKELLLLKNKNYGDSALHPIRVFSKNSSLEGLMIRIDDKLSRIKTVGITDETEDTVKDLVGYLILLMIAREEDESNSI